MVYKKYKINPLSSCLFAIIQIPLLFAFLEAINRTPAIFEGNFLGLHLGITPMIALRNGEWWYLILTVILALVTYFSMSRNMNANMGNAETAKQILVSELSQTHGNVKPTACVQITKAEYEEAMA